MGPCLSSYPMSRERERKPETSKGGGGFFFVSVASPFLFRKGPGETWRGEGVVCPSSDRPRASDVARAHVPGSKRVCGYIIALNGGPLLSTKTRGWPHWAHLIHW